MSIFSDRSNEKPSARKATSPPTEPMLIIGSGPRLHIRICDCSATSMVRRVDFPGSPRAGFLFSQYGEHKKSWECLVSCAVIVQRVEADQTGPYLTVASGQADATMNTYGVSKLIAKGRPLLPRNRLSMVAMHCHRQNHSPISQRPRKGARPMDEDLACTSVAARLLRRDRQADASCRQRRRNNQIDGRSFWLIKAACHGEQFLLSPHPANVFSRNELLDGVWGRDVYIDERTVDVHVGRLRKALACHRLPDPFRTVRGSGYSFDEECAEKAKTARAGANGARTAVHG